MTQILTAKLFSHNAQQKAREITIVNPCNFRVEGSAFENEMKMAKPYQWYIAFMLIISGTACTSLPTATPSSVAMPAASATPSVTPVTRPVITENPTATIGPVQTEIGIDDDQVNATRLETNLMNIQIDNTVFSATLAENSSAAALKELLAKGPITINMRDYGSMEKVGPLGADLPRNDQQITTEAGDIILYQGNAFVIYYAPNSWNFTRLGKIENVTSEKLKEILGDGNVTITLSLPD
jgi:hypothetical protein